MPTEKLPNTNSVAFNPDVEDAYWQQHYLSRPGYINGYSYTDDYAVAYRVGYQGRSRHTGSYADHENDLGVEWERVKGNSRLTWDQAKAAIREAWEHAQLQLPTQISATDPSEPTTMNKELDTASIIPSPVNTDPGAYWREHYASSPSYKTDYTYEDDYAAAYRIGYEARNFYKTTFEDNEATLKEEWERQKSKSRLTWEEAKTAMREAWDHIEQEMPVNAALAPNS